MITSDIAFFSFIYMVVFVLICIWSKTIYFTTTYNFTRPTAILFGNKYKFTFKFIITLKIKNSIYIKTHFNSSNCKKLNKIFSLYLQYYVLLFKKINLNVRLNFNFLLFLIKLLFSI